MAGLTNHSTGLARKATQTGEFRRYAPKILPMKTLLLIALCVSLPTFADSPENLPVPVDVLSELVSSTSESQPPFESRTYRDGDKMVSYYFAKCEYVGSSNAPFGKVYSALFTYRHNERRAGQHSIRVGPDTRLLAFFDSSFRMRAYWDLTGHQELAFVLYRSQLFLGKTVIFSFDKPPADNLVVLEGKTYEVPSWNK